MYTEGSDVRAGQELYHVDAAPYQAAEHSAQAQLAQAQAQLANASALVTRFRPLVAANAVSKQEFDAAVAAGRLPLDHPHALPPPAAHARLTLVPPPGSAAAARERLQAMAEQLRAKPERPSVAQLEHERIRALKAETAQRVADRIATEA